MRWARATEARARKINRIRRIATHQKAAAIKPQPQITPQGGALSKPPSGFGGGSKPPSVARTLQPAAFLEIDDLENGHGEHDQQADKIAVRLEQLRHVPRQLFP